MAKKQMAINEGFNEILLYTAPNGKVRVEIYLQNETIWLTQQKIADLEYIIKGLTMDNERLKNPNNIFGKDCFISRH